jgi:endonuclease/exonuclease/phosphatase family metal-dependent hydrolase
MAQDVAYIPYGFMFWTFNARTGEATCHYASSGYQPYGSGSLDGACSDGPGDTYAFWGDFIRYITDRAHAQYVPDLLCLQEVGNDNAGPPPRNEAEAGDVITILEELTGITYGCIDSEHTGGGTIAYRKGAGSNGNQGWELINHERVQLYGRNEYHYACEVLSYNPALLFYLRSLDAPQRQLMVACVHNLPEARPNGARNGCPGDNLHRMKYHLKNDFGAAADGIIVAGDFNAASDEFGTYGDDYGYPQDMNDASVTVGDGQETHNGKRIDYAFSQPEAANLHPVLEVTAPRAAEYAYSGSQTPDGIGHNCSDHRGVGVVYGW